MVQTSFAMPLYDSMLAHEAACHTLLKAFFETSEDMVYVFLMIEVLFTQDSGVTNLFGV